MPYINRDERINLGGGWRPPQTPGELNYLLTNLVADYVEGLGVSYGSLNEAVGVLECAKLELYRRMAAPYENEKRRENGDIPQYERSADREHESIKAAWRNHWSNR